MNSPSLLLRGQSLWQTITQGIDSLRAPAALVARLYLAQAFFLAGLTKIRDWDITLLLFTEEYKVPLLSPEIAAVMGTAGELVLPVLLVFGLAGRFAALGLSVVNVVAVLSLSEIAPAALQQHITWGSCWPPWCCTGSASGQSTACGCNRASNVAFARTDSPTTGDLSCHSPLFLAAFSCRVPLRPVRCP